MSWCSCLGSLFLSSVSIFAILWGLNWAFSNKSWETKLANGCTLFKLSQSKIKTGGGGHVKQHKSSWALLLWNRYLQLLKQSFRDLLPADAFIGRYWLINVFCYAVMFIHASLRLRNIKNKLENKKEEIGLKKTPMGIILDALEQQEDNINKLASYIPKVKE